jgi:molybdopterin converting factor small subunit
VPIVDGKYEMKIGATFATVEEGIAEIKRMIQKSRRIRISNVPMSLLEELKTLLKDKDLMIILPMNEKPSEELKQLAPTATTKARIYVDYKGEEANSGSITFASTVFNIAWVNNRVLGVSTMEYGKCVKCLAGTFEGGWRYSQKW